MKYEKGLFTSILMFIIVILIIIFSCYIHMKEFEIKKEKTNQDIINKIVLELNKKENIK